MVTKFIMEVVVITRVEVEVATVIGETNEARTTVVVKAEVTVGAVLYWSAPCYQHLCLFPLPQALAL